MSLTAAAASDLFRREPDRFLDIGPGKGQAAYRRVGSGPDVLFVHGWPVTSATFRLLLPHLVDHVTCHLDRPPGRRRQQVHRRHRPVDRQPHPQRAPRDRPARTGERRRRRPRQRRHDRTPCRRRRPSPPRARPDRHRAVRRAQLEVQDVPRRPPPARLRRRPRLGGRQAAPAPQPVRARRCLPDSVAAGGRVRRVLPAQRCTPIATT